MTDDCLAPLAAKLTYNGARNLRSFALDPCPLNPDAVHGKGRIYTGLGKWTTLGAIGVENHLKSLGLARDAVRRVGDPYTYVQITDLGRAMAVYLAEHWDDLCGSFRDGRKRS